MAKYTAPDGAEVDALQKDDGHWFVYLDGLKYEIERGYFSKHYNQTYPRAVKEQDELQGLPVLAGAFQGVCVGGLSEQVHDA